MALINEVTPSSLQAALDAGIDVLDRDETVVFTQYTKSTIPTDGYVFWVKTLNTITVKGSLHYGTERLQEEDQTIGSNDVVFSSEEEVTAFNAVSPGSMWVGSWPTDASGINLQVAFAKRGHFYQNAQVWHYTGFAVYPAMSAQLIASAGDLPTGPIVSNSLPIWLSQNSLAPVYPSFLVPDNVTPPYITAHISPEKTEPVGQFPIYFWPGNPTPMTDLQEMNCDQLIRDYVRLTLYGFTNQMAIQFYVDLIELSKTDVFGFANSPVIRDEKRTQPEIAAIAQKKTIEIEANYYQAAADVIARRLILSAGMKLIFP
jgi:hypothetical protein